MKQHTWQEWININISTCQHINISNICARQETSAWSTILLSHFLHSHSRLQALLARQPPHLRHRSPSTAAARVGTGHRHTENFLDVLRQYGGPAAIQGSDLGLNHRVCHAAATMKQGCEEVHCLLSLLRVQGFLNLGC